jgi:YHS domain-containing protein
MRTMKLLTHRTLLLGIIASILVGTSSCSTNRMFTNSATNPYTDPVCGVPLEPDVAIMQEYKGTTYYFDSEECLSVFNKNPKNFTKIRNRPNGNHMGFSQIGWWAPVMVATMAGVMLVGLNH